MYMLTGNLSHGDKDGNENENVGYATVEESFIGKKTVTRSLYTLLIIIIHYFANKNIYICIPYYNI